MYNVSAQIILYYYCSPSRQQSIKCDVSLHFLLSVAKRKLGLAFLRCHGCHVLVLAAQKSYHRLFSTPLLAKAMRRVINS